MTDAEEDMMYEEREKAEAYEDDVQPPAKPASPKRRQNAPRGQHSKRIRLSVEDMVLITVALEHLHDSSIINPTVYPKYAAASKQRINQIIGRFGAHSAPQGGQDE